MEQHCTRCGHVLGIGRFCVNCGHAVGHPTPAAGADDWRTSTAERPATPPDAGPAPAPGAVPPVSPIAPPPAYTTPPKVRYPLFADETPAPSTEATVPAWEAPPPVDHAYASGPTHRSRRVAPWLVVAAALLLVAALGGFLLVGGSGDDDPGPGGATASDTPAPDDGDPSTPGDPDGDPDDPGDDPGPADDEPRDVAVAATATASETASPSRDVDGNAVRYEASNMVDGQGDTAWRMPGAGVGAVLTFDLGESVVIDQVGLLNGYAKQDPGYDGYPANRRVTRVEWVFDDGTTVEQTLVDGERDVQLVDTGGVEAASVELHVLEVTKPGKGPSGRDYTAISEVSLVGVPL